MSLARFPRPQHTARRVDGAELRAFFGRAGIAVPSATMAALEDARVYDVTAGELAAIADHGASAEALLAKLAPPAGEEFSPAEAAAIAAGASSATVLARRALPKVDP